MEDGQLHEGCCDSIGEISFLDVGLAPLAHILSFLNIKDICRASEVRYIKGFRP